MKRTLLSFVFLFLCIDSSATGQDRQKRRGGGESDGIIKPRFSDTVPVNVYADNWFQLYINGKLVAVDSIDFVPHNVISVDILPEFPMTIAVMAKDNADPITALEYNDTNIGDGGFILKIGDDIVTDSSWKAKNFFHGPINGDLKNRKVVYHEIPPNWFAVEFDDSNWQSAIEHSEESVGPKQPFYERDFAGAKFIWTENLKLDNTIIFRKVIEKPGWQARWNVGRR